jgi:hypothetical protein
MNTENTDSRSVDRFMIVMLLIADSVLILQLEKLFTARHGSYVNGLTPRMFSSVYLTSWIMILLLTTGIILLYKAWESKR